MRARAAVSSGFVTVLTAVLVLAGLTHSASGAGELEEGLYEVIQCAPDHRDAPDALINAPPGYDARSRCDRRYDGRTLRIASNQRVAEGQIARIAFAAPPSTEITAIAVEANLQRSKGHNVTLTMTDSEGRDAGMIANGGQAYDGWRTERWSGDTGRARLVLRVTCERDPCDEAPDLRASMRNVRLTLRDLSAPVLDRVEGPLIERTWLTDEADIGLVGFDAGAGLVRLSATINDSAEGPVSTTCAALRTGEALRLRPCDGAKEFRQTFQVDESPFLEGENRVDICARDFAGLSDCEEHVVSVDTEVPTGAFLEQSSLDPELLRVLTADSTSGVASGQIRFRRLGSANWIDLTTSTVEDELHARIDSAAYPEGTYEFEAVVKDIAGNSTAVSTRQDGSPMVVEFPLRESASVRGRIGRSGRGSTIGYGRSSQVKGALVDSDGRPIADREITVTEFFSDGALISERVRMVRTSSSGEFRSLLPNGPSRRVQVTYEGDEQFLPDSEAAGKLRVRSEATLKMSRKRIRAGDRVRFTGRVGRLGARMPPGGKLVELQVQERPGKYNTIRQAFTTNRQGRFRFKYRFGRFYTEPVRFKFKLKVVREQGWPYVTPVRSRARGLRIKPR